MSYERLINQCGLYVDKIRIFLKNSGCGLYTGALNRPKITVVCFSNRPSKISDKEDEQKLVCFSNRPSKISDKEDEQKLVCFSNRPSKLSDKEDEQKLVCFSNRPSKISDKEDNRN